MVGLEERVVVWCARSRGDVAVSDMADIRRVCVYAAGRRVKGGDYAMIKSLGICRGEQSECPVVRGECSAGNVSISQSGHAARMEVPEGAYDVARILSNRQPLSTALPNAASG